MSKKDLLANALFYTGLLRIVGLWNRLFKKNLVILAYHRVLPSWEDESYPGDLELISTSTLSFDWQMRHLKAHFRTVSFPQLDAIVKEESPPSGGVVLVTFDDGFIDNYEHAYPILQKYELPAAIFVTLGYVGKSQTFWFERMSEQLKILKNQRVSFPMLELEIEIGDDLASISSAFEELVDKLKLVPDPVRLDALDHLDSLTKNAPLKVDTISRPLNWSELIELSENNISIQPHTRTHPSLSHCTEEKIYDELVEAKRELERKLNRKCDMFSYPFGGEDLCNPKVLGCLEEGGYALACTYKPAGGNNLTNFEKYQIKRIHVERYTSKARFAAALVLPQVFN